jgi:hypothetical protein
MVMVLLAFITPWILVVFVLPFIYSMVAVFFIFPIRIYEDASFGEALSRCFYLVSGNWWRTFLVYFVVSMVVSLVSYIFILPMYIYIFAVSFASAKGSSFETSMGIMIAVNIFAFVGQIILSSIPLITLNFQYFNLLEKKDKPGLMKRVNDLLPNDTTINAQ